ncbi:unnamed protein product [Chrysoparadoxa australica]
MSFMLRNVRGAAREVMHKWYRGRVERSLRDYGLKYEDTFIEHPEVLEAISRLPPEVQQARQRRINRAFDISAKKKPLEGAARDNQDPWERYMTKELAQVQAERREYELLNGWHFRGFSNPWK